VYSPPKGPSVKVGRLDFDGELWTFRYEDEYKTRTDLRPIEGFVDLEKVYRSPVLFPFFAVRIPHEDRADVRRKLDADNISERDTIDLLRLFGRHVVSSPAFQLIPAA
jgi:HipA-like protein